MPEHRCFRTGYQVERPVTVKPIEALRWRVPGTHVGVVVALSLVLALIGSDGPDADAAEELDSKCSARASSAPSTSLMRLREELSVVTRARFDCIAPIRPFHLAIVADAGSIMPSGTAAWIAPAVRALGERVRLDLNHKVRIGAIEFANMVETLCEPTGDSDVLRACLELLGKGMEPPRSRESALGDALVRAADQLVRIRGDHAGADPPHELILVLVDPSSIERSNDPEIACEDARRAISAASMLGIESEIVCLSETCRKSCVHDLVDAGRVHRMEDWRDISGFVVSEAWASELRVRHVAVHERLGAGFDFKAGSPDPGGANYDPTGHTLDWRIDAYGRRTLHVSYALAARRSGTQPIRDSEFGGIAQFTDTRGGVGTFDLGNSMIGVVERDFFTAFLPRLHQPECDLCTRPDRAGRSAP